MMGKMLLLAALAAAFAVHMRHSYTNDSRKRPYTKVLLVPLILAWYLLCAESPDRFLVAALIAAWVGDVLLMPAGDKWFVAGGVAFLAAHVLFILVFAPQIRAGALRPAVLLPAALAYLAAVWLVFRRVWKPAPKAMRMPMAAYLVANTVMNLCAMARAMSLPGPGPVIAWTGALLFFASDCLLFLVDYGGLKERLRHYFYVMLTYVPGVFLITLGVLLSS